MTVDQAAIISILAFLRYAMKPRQAKPRSSIAHMEGSGTPFVTLLLKTNE